MTVYSVFDRRLDEAPAVVPDRFSWFAALLPPLYGLVHGLWLGLVLWVLAVAAIVAGGLWLGAEAGGPLEGGDGVMRQRVASPACTSLTSSPGCSRIAHT